MELLRQLVLAAQESDELPTDITEVIVQLAAIPKHLQEKERLLRILLKQVSSYDPYADTGCFGSGATLADIKRTLEHIVS